MAGAIRIGVDAELVVTDGNYLLLRDPGWAAVRELVDEAWMLEPDDAVRVPALVARHEHHGRTAAAAHAWVRDVDERNAQLVRERSAPPDLLIQGYVTR